MILLQVAFDIDVDVIRDPNSPFPSAVSKGLKGAQESIRTPFPQLFGLVFPSQSGLAEAIKFIREFAGNVIKERQEAVLRGDETPNDILAHILKVAESESSLSFEDLIDQFLTFFVAGKTFYQFWWTFCGVELIGGTYCLHVSRKV